MSVSDIEIFALPIFPEVPEGITICAALNVPVVLPVIVPETVSVPLTAHVTAAEKFAVPVAFIVNEMQEDATLMLTVCPVEIVTLSEAPGTPLGVQIVEVFQLPVALLT